MSTARLHVDAAEIRLRSFNFEVRRFARFRRAAGLRCSFTLRIVVRPAAGDLTIVDHVFLWWMSPDVTE
jgi:hypothetical protein